MHADLSQFPHAGGVEKYEHFYTHDLLNESSRCLYSWSTYSHTLTDTHKHIFTHPNIQAFAHTHTHLVTRALAIQRFNTSLRLNCTAATILYTVGCGNYTTCKYTLDLVQKNFYSAVLNKKKINVNIINIKFIHFALLFN